MVIPDKLPEYSITISPGLLLLLPLFLFLLPALYFMISAIYINRRRGSNAAVTHLRWGALILTVLGMLLLISMIALMFAAKPLLAIGATLALAWILTAMATGVVTIFLAAAIPFLLPALYFMISAMRSEPTETTTVEQPHSTV